VRDSKPTPTLASVSVTGPGIADVLNLTYDAFSGNWYPMTGTPFLGSTPPSVAQTYTITVTEGATQYPYTRTITGYVTDFAVINSPFGSFGSPVVFTWRGIPGATQYGVVVNNDQGQRIWQSYDFPRTQWGAVYDGPALEAGENL
jgi:hypothetical protein